MPPSSTTPTRPSSARWDPRPTCGPGSATSGQARAAAAHRRRRRSRGARGVPGGGGQRRRPVSRGVAHACRERARREAGGAGGVAADGRRRGPDDRWGAAGRPPTSRSWTASTPGTVTAEYAEPVLCQVDGDVVGTVRRIRFDVVPAAVRVVLPSPPPFPLSGTTSRRMSRRPAGAPATGSDGHWLRAVSWAVGARSEGWVGWGRDCWPVDAAGGRFSRFPRVVADGWGQAGGGIAAIRANAATSCSTQGQVLGRRSRRRRAP